MKKLPTKRAKPPNKTTAQLTSTASKELADLLDAGKHLIEQEILRSQPDPEHEALTGSMRKALEQQARDQERRQRHGAPPPPPHARLAKALGATTYDLPSYLEPLAELARQRTEDELRTALHNTTSTEETEAEIRATRWERQHRDTWERLLAKHGGPNKVREDPSWDTIDKLATEAAIQADLTKERWDGYRAEAKEALRKATQYANEDGATLTALSLHELHARVTLDKQEASKYINGMKTNVPFRLTIPEASVSGRIELALEPITLEMNLNPLKVNDATWERNRNRQKETRDELYAACAKKAGKSFRPHSSRDCAKILFTEQGLSPRRINTKSGEPAVDQETLAALQAEGSELAGAIIDAREAQAKLSQLENWEPYARAGEVQTEWNSLGSPHARYTSSNPNLQSRVREIRETVEAPEGYSFLSFDLGQAEYITWASLSGDETLKKAFANGADFHTTMFEELHKAAPNIDLHGQAPRQFGKTTNFALLYLQQPHVLAQKLGVSTEEAADLMDAYAERAPDAVAYRDGYLEEFNRTGVTSTYFGRSRELGKPNRHDKHDLEKTAWHMRVSGTAAELLKIKQIKSYKRLRKAGLGPEDARIVLNMHDELIFQVRDEYLGQAKEIVSGVFHELIPGFLPFHVDQRTGRNWLEISK